MQSLSPTKSKFSKSKKLTPLYFVDTAAQALENIVIVHKECITHVYFQLVIP